MSTLLSKPVRICRTITTSPVHARALEDPVRVRILHLLYRRSLSASQIADSLGKLGLKKAITTVRHHLDVLRGSGLIEVVRIDESRGSVTKYYGTSTRLLGYNAPEDFDDRYSSAIQETTKKMEAIIKELAPKATRKTRGQKKDPEYSQYVAMEIVNRAMTTLLEKKGRRAEKVPARQRDIQ